MNSHSRGWSKILTTLVFVSIFIFVLAAILPGRPFWFGARKLFYLCLFVTVVKGLWLRRSGTPSGYWGILPFLWLFLFSLFGFSRFPEYSFGVDDAHYYSYMPSILLDGDLDFSNEYQLTGLLVRQDPKAREERTPIGKRPNVFPVGPAIFWTPFFLLAHLMAGVAGLPQNGFDRIYTHLVGAGNLLYACTGLYLCFRFCSLFFHRMLALISTIVLLFTTPYLWLFFRSYLLTSEPLSLACIAAFLVLLHHLQRSTADEGTSPDARHGTRWLFAGLLLGAMTMVRFHNAVAGIVPAVFFVLQWRHTGGKVLLPFACFVAGVLLGFVPQLIIWKFLYGEWFVSMGGAFLPHWMNPFVLETLFSARKGLFPWSPIALLSVTGLWFFLGKERKWGWCLVAILIGTIYINSSQADWWGATSLGSRRFVPIVALFIVGLASLYTILPRMVRPALMLVCAFFVWLNFFFVASFREGSLSSDHADRFSDILNGPYQLYEPIAYALQFPVQLAYTIRYGTPFYGPWNEYFIGEDVFYFQQRTGPEMIHPQSPLFGEGWEVSGSARTTNRAIGEIYVPMFMKEKPRIMVQIDLVPVDHANDVWVDFYLNGKFLRSRKISTEGRQFDLPIRSREYGNAVNSLTLHIYHSQTRETVPHLMLKGIHFREARDVAGRQDPNEP